MALFDTMLLNLTMPLKQEDQEGLMRTIADKYIDEGIAQGMQIGRNEGMQIGEAKGLQIGRNEGNMK